MLSAVPHAVVVGETIMVDGIEYSVIRAVPGEPLHLHSGKTGAVRTDVTVHDWHKLWTERRAWRVRDASIITAKQHARAQRVAKKDYEDLDPDTKLIVDRKLLYLRRIELKGFSFSDRDLQEVLPIIALEYQEERRRTDPKFVEEKPHPRTVRQWHKVKEATGSAMALAPDHSSKGNRSPRFPPVIESLIEEAIRSHLKPGRTSTDMIGFIQSRLKQLHPNIPDNELPWVSRKAIRRRVQMLSATHRLLNTEGRRATRVIMRGGAGLPPPEFATDMVELDHTELPILVCDDAHEMLPLGRPTLALAIDVKTGMIMGRYIGFTPESDFTNLMCLKHAMLPKIDLDKKFPGIEHDWPTWGIPRMLVMDNARQNDSRSTLALCNVLDIEPHFTPPRTAWYKPRVESLMNAVQAGCIKNNEGNTIRVAWAEGNDAADELPCISLKELDHVIHKWIIGEHNQKPSEALSLTPHRLWLDSLAQHLPRQLDRNEHYIYGIVETRHLDHRGIKYKHIIYNDDACVRLRHECGAAGIEVTIKIDPADLGRIWVKHPHKDEYYEVQANHAWRDYASGGLHLHQHKCIMARNRQTFNALDNPRAYLRCRQEMHDYVTDRLNLRRMKMGDRSRLARYAAVGNEAEFNSEFRQSASSPGQSAAAAPAAPPPVLPLATPKAQKKRPAEDTSADEFATVSVAGQSSNLPTTISNVLGD